MHPSRHRDVFCSYNSFDHAAVECIARALDETRTWVREGRPDARRWRHELLGPARGLLGEAGLLAAMEREAGVADFLIPEAKWLLAELLCSGTDHARRETIGMRLSEIGDNRPGVGLRDGVPEILWCDVDVPAGEGGV